MVTVYSWGWSGEKGVIVCRGVGEGVASMISRWCGRERRGGVVRRAADVRWWFAGNCP